MKFFSKRELIILTLLFVLSFVPVVGGAIRILEIAGGPSVAPDNPRISNDPFPALLHLLGAIPFCILGAFQFMPSLRRYAPKWHRLNGRIVAFSGIVAAISGLWMTNYYALSIEIQGDLLYVVRMVLGTAMVLFIVRGVAAIRGRKISQHHASMTRAYAIGQGAATQTLMGLIWIALLREEPTGLMRDIMMTSAWVINLTLAEWIIRKTNNLSVSGSVS